MKVEGNYTFSAPREQVWQILLDPDALARMMPGCESLKRVGDNEYEAVLRIRVGPVDGTYTGKIVLDDLRPPEHYRMRVNGQGNAGFMQGEGTLDLEEQNGNTLLKYRGETQVGGRVANVGQRLIGSVATHLINQGLKRLEAELGSHPLG
jgi:carbon monoxide dehydrogenase subunit G